MRDVKFSVEDLKTPESLERVLRQFQTAMTASVSTVASSVPNLSTLVGQLAPILQKQLQANGISPLNLQSLLPTLGTAIFTEDTHANRATLYTPPTSQGTVFYETDRTVVYISILSSGALAWRYYAGTYYDSLANRPADLTTADANFRFVANDADQQIEYFWTGTEWVTIDYLQEVEDAATNSVSTVQILRHLSSGNPANGFGARQLIQQEDASHSTESCVSLESKWDDATHASVTSSWAVFLRNGAAALGEYFRVTILGIKVTVGGFTALFSPSITGNVTYTFPDATTNIVHETSNLTNDNFVLGNGNAKVKDATFATVPINKGGTNATTAAGAITNLGAATAQAPGAHTITLAKITGGGANGSITWAADGVISSFVDPT